MRNTSYIAVTFLLFIYISLVFFCCLYNFSDGNIDMGKYFLGIRLDRYIHFAMFFPYPFIGWMFLNYNKKVLVYKKYTFAAIILSGIFLASAAEASQELFTTYRDTDPFDLGSNVTGIFAGTLAVYIFQRPLIKICDKLFKLQHLWNGQKKQTSAYD